MIHDFDRGSLSPIYTHTAKVIKVAPAIKSRYSASPETVVHFLVEVDFDGDSRLMRFKDEASRFRVLPLLRPGEECTISSHSFTGDQIYPQKIAPKWLNLRVAPELPADFPADGIRPAVTARARIDQIVEAFEANHQRLETVLHMRFTLLLDGKERVAYAELKPSKYIDAPLLRVGYTVELSFYDYHGAPGQLHLQTLKVDWPEMLKFDAAQNEK
jgi:hypothetical protein